MILNIENGIFLSYNFIKKCVDFLNKGYFVSNVYLVKK